MRKKIRHQKINGLPVKNGKKSISIEVTDRDVKNATMKDPTNCVAAVACRRDLGCTEARVHVGRTYLRFNGHWERYLTSKNLRDEIIAYDRGGRFIPGEYVLMKMTPTKRTNKRQGSDKPRKYASKRRGYHALHVRPIGIYA